MKRKTIYMIMATIIILTSCDDFLNVNENPNDATTSTPELVLSAALNATAGRLTHNQIGAMWAGQWCPSGDVSGFVAEKTYDFSNTYGTAIWTSIYDNLMDYQYIVSEAQKEGKKGLTYVGKIMMAYNYHILVDTYNNVPYTDALKGLALIRPSYTDGQSVYEGIIEDLTEAADSLKSIKDANDVLGNGDIFFGGNYPMWIRFANTLKLRLLIRQSEMPGRENYIKAEIAKIKPAVGTDASTRFLATDVNSNPSYLKTSGKQNQFWDNYYHDENDNLRNTYNFIRSTQFLKDNLDNDYRIYWIMGTSGSGSFGVTFSTRTGVTYGDETSAAYSNATSGIGFGILKAYNMPMTVFTASESYFLQAEAVLKGYMGGDVESLYKNGVIASYKLLGVTDEDGDASYHANDFLSNAGAWDGELKTLITQKWIATVGYSGFEAWCDYRRTGYPGVPLSTKAIKDAIPVRLYYPAQELQTNAENLAKQGTIDAITSKVFWDAN